MEENIKTTITDPPPEFKMKNWNDKIEKSIKLIEKQCRLYKKIHNKVALDNINKYSYFMMAAIFITPLSGVVTTIGTIFCRDLDDMYIYNTTTTLLSFLSGILITIIKFNKYDEVSYAHKTASSRYISLEENIRRQLMLYREDRINANEYLNWISKSFDELYSSAPDFESSITKQYEEQLENIEKEYDNVEINLTRPDSLKNNKFLQYQDLSLFDDQKMKLDMNLI